MKSGMKGIVISSVSHDRSVQFSGSFGNEHLDWMTSNVLEDAGHLVSVTLRLFHSSLSMNVENALGCPQAQEQSLWAQCTGAQACSAQHPPWLPAPVCPAGVPAAKARLFWGPRLPRHGSTWVLEKPSTLHETFSSVSSGPSLVTEHLLCTHLV